MRPEKRAKEHRPKFESQWSPTASLIRELAPESQNVLEIFPEILAQVWPLSKIHKRELPGDIRDLSAMLTCQRAELVKNYWQKPAFISAYLYYFLPWNLVRLCRLLPSLPLQPPQTKDGALPLLLDAGSGPLTLPLALWLCKPEWRKAPIHIFALDASKQPLELGKALFKALAEKLKTQVWPIRYSVGPLEDLAKTAPRHTESDQTLYPWLGAAANTLNEFKIDASELDTRLDRLLNSWRPIWEAGAELLFIEPGTRLGGSTIMHLREVGLELGLYPLSPCTHARPCPLLQSSRPGLANSWCHFIFSGQDAPGWLKELSKKAGLFKTSLTLSPLLLSKNKPPKESDKLACRVISQAFPVGETTARYVCAPCGLGLIKGAPKAPSGSLCLAKIPAAPEKDKKSGALILDPADPAVKRPARPHKQGSRSADKTGSKGDKNVANSTRPR